MTIRSILVFLALTGVTGPALAQGAAPPAVVGSRALGAEDFRHFLACRPQQVCAVVSPAMSAVPAPVAGK